jgi:hypothetical protein
MDDQLRATFGSLVTNGQKEPVHFDRIGGIGGKPLFSEEEGSCMPTVGVVDG